MTRIILTLIALLNTPMLIAGTLAYRKADVVIIPIHGHIDMDVTSVRASDLLAKVVAGLLEKKKIVLDIDSGGGRMTQATLDLLQLMSTSPVECVITGSAGSLATIIYSACSTRYALVGTKVMWHPPRADCGAYASSPFSGVTPIEAQRCADSLKEADEIFWAPTRAFFTPEYFMDNYNRERNIPVAEVVKNAVKHYLTIVDVLVVQE